MSRLRRWLPYLAVAAALAIVVPRLGSQWQSAVISVLYAMYLCVAWNVIAGFAGQFALGQPVFLAAGAYTSSLLLLQRHVSPWLGMLAGCVLAGLLAAGLGYLAFRYRVRGLYFALLTFASLVVAATLVANWDAVGGAAGLLLPLGDSWAGFVWKSRLPYLYVLLVLVAAVTVVTTWLSGGRLGWLLAAVGQDEEAAAAVGIPVARVKLAAFVLSAVLTAPAGTFYAQYYQLVSPDTVLAFDPQIRMMVGTIVGGPGTVVGPLVGGALTGGFDQLIQNLPLDSHAAAALGAIVYALFLVLMSLYAPRGIVGLVRRGSERRAGRARRSWLEQAVRGR
jgi:branched-chain amino acid transport system permease protein